MELIKKILLHIEVSPNFNEPIQTSVDGYEIIDYMYHVKLLREAGFIEIFTNQPISVMGTVPSYFPTCLTWEGHEFLEATKNPTIWKKVMLTIKEKGSGIPIEILKALLIKESLKQFGL